MHTNALNDLRQNHKQHTRKKIHDNHLDGRPYSSDNASFKLHISIHNIPEVDDSIITGLIDILIQTAHSSDNMHFIFKIINPVILESEKNLNPPRFIDHDQFTLYFDKYTSIAEIIALSNQVNDYLQSKHLTNNGSSGPKDSIKFNAFITGRFDTNKIHNRYNTYPFYDEQLVLFFNRHQHEIQGFNEVPICVFETVFNAIIIDTSITNLNEKAFNRLYGERIQAQFDLIVNNPQKYIQNPEYLITEVPPTNNQVITCSEELLHSHFIQLDSSTEECEEAPQQRPDDSIAQLEPCQDLPVSEPQDTNAPLAETSMFERFIEHIKRIINWIITLLSSTLRFSSHKSTLFVPKPSYKSPDDGHSAEATHHP